jgi:hypothetical protein
MRRRLVALAAVLALAAGAGAYVRAAATDEPDRREQVASRGAEVMRFDLDATTHLFEKLPGGGVQTVVAHDARDAAEIRKVRVHLRAEAVAFARGRYDDPAAIHGAAMPGLADLRAGAARIDVAYGDVPNGGRITYVTSDPALVRALHAWFEAQVSDHGRHAAEVE